MDEAGNSTDEKIFNLQLLVQKLEEELMLYRNGTSVSELLDVIHEKDIEVETWRAKHDEKDEKLKRLAKTSGDVLMKYERLQQELIRQEEIKQTEEMHVQALVEENQRLCRDIESMQLEMANLHEQMKTRDDEIGALRLAQWEIEQEQTTKQSTFQQELSKYQEEHMQEQSSLKSNIDLLEAQIRDHKMREEALAQEVRHWKTLADEQDQSIASLQKRCASLVKDKNDRLSKLDEERQEMVQQVQQFRENMSDNLRQRDEALQKKDDKIRELTFQVNMLQQEIRLKNQRIAQGFGAVSTESTSSSTAPTTIFTSTTLASTASTKPGSALESPRHSSKSRPALVEKTNSLVSSADAVATGAAGGVKEKKNKAVKIVDYTEQEIASEAKGGAPQSSVTFAVEVDRI